jgi:hypothetical protein
MVAARMARHDSELAGGKRFADGRYMTLHRSTAHAAGAPNRTETGMRNFPKNVHLQVSRHPDTADIAR